MQATLDIHIVSHGTPLLVAQLLDDLRGAPARIRVLENVAGVEHVLPAGVELLRWPDGRERGFAENHTFLAARGDGELIAILNPDLRVDAAVFEALLAQFADPAVGVVAPRVRAPGGRLEDNARRLLTPWRLLRDRLWRARRRTDYGDPTTICEPDWVAGMFMVVRRKLFSRIGGLDRRYRMYCEDMDFCVRAWLAGYRVVCLPSEMVIHDARRASLKDLRHLGWHVASLLRFWCSAAYWRFLFGGRPGAAMITTGGR